MLGVNGLLQNEVFPPPMRTGAWLYEERLLKESARLGVCYRALAETLGIDFADAGMGDVETVYDGVHFSKTGHTAFAEDLLKQLSEMGLYDSVKKI